MSWLDFMIDTKGIRAIYGDHIPSLDGITLQEIIFDYDRSSVILGFDLPELPVVLPKKWERKGVDFVRLDIEFSVISELSIQGWKAPLVVNLRLAKTNGGEVNTVIDSEVFDFSVTARFVRPRGISAHKTSSR